MATVDIHVKGLAELQKYMEQLTPKIEKNIMRGALRAGAKLIQAAAISNAGRHSAFIEGYRTRAMQKKIRLGLARNIRVGTRSRRGVVTAVVKAGVFYAKFVEFGTRAHTIKAAPGGVLAIGGGFYTSVQHPGSRPKPFLRPALDSQAHAAVVATAQYIRNRLATKHGLDTAETLLIGDETEAGPYVQGRDALGRFT